MRTCPHCERLLPDEDFYFRLGRANGYCKPCRKLLSAAWQKANPEAAARIRRKWQHSEKGRRCHRKRNRDYERSARGKATHARANQRYFASEKGHQAMQRAQEKRKILK